MGRAQRGIAVNGDPIPDRQAQVVPLLRPDHGRIPAAHDRGLPRYASSFLGRRRDARQVAELLAAARLITLTGPGGVGKTRLAVEVARRVAGAAPFFVDLAPLAEGARVPDEIADAFGVELRGRSLAYVLDGELSGDALLLLDNCEHLAAACAEETDRLLRGCGKLRILATSQQRLDVPGEVVWPVQGLPLPDPADEVAPEAALVSPAVRLFRERARAVQPAFAPSPTDVTAIREICRRLGGNPLGIELAAARIDVLTPAEIAARLRDCFDVLRRSSGAGPARHRTFAAALEWSSGLLEEPERVLLRRLAVFAGGFGLQAAEEVCVGGQVERDRILELLSGLVARSLIVADTSGSVARYRLLETIRQHAADRLARAGETDAVHARHAEWCLGLVARCAELEDESCGVTSIEVEQDNLRAALDRALAAGQAALALHLARGMMLFWQRSGRFTEARECLVRVLSTRASVPPALCAGALHDAGFAAFMLGDFDAAQADLRDSLAVSDRIGDTAAAERTRGLLTFVSTLGDGPTDVDTLDEDLERVRTSGDDARLAEVLQACGHARMFRGEPAAAHRCFEELLEVARRRGDGALAATALVGLGSAALGRGDYAAAEGHLDEGVHLATEAADTQTGAVGRIWRAELARLRGDHSRARAEFERCLEQARSLGAPYPLATAQLGLGRVLLDLGDTDRALPLFDEARQGAGHAGLTHVVAAALEASGAVALAVGEPAGARSRFEEALEVARGCDDVSGTARATYQLAELARADGDLAEAARLHDVALRRRHRIGERAAAVDSLEALVGVNATRGRHEVAARLLGAAEAQRERSGWPRPPTRAAGWEADLALLHERMTPGDLDEARDQGAALGYDEAVAYARRGRGPRGRPAEGAGSLTPAEHEVVALVAEGLTNPEVAERLFVSPRTVQSHLRSVYAKLGINSRRQLRDVLPPGT